MTDQQPNTEGVYDRLRRAILEDLRHRIEKAPGRCPEKLEIPNQARVKSLLRCEADVERDEEQTHALVCEIYHELYLEHIIVPGSGDLSAGSVNAMRWPWFRVTDHGRRVLEASEYSPYDPDGYLRRLKGEIPSVDETIVRYVEESLRCLRMDCLLAAAVTIGCASEQAVLLLIEQFGQAITDPKSKREYEDDTSSWIIARKYKAFRKSLDSAAKDLPKPLRDPLKQQLHGVFDLIRRTRNDAGHPTGEPITRETVLASQIVFPGYCKYVYSLKDHFAKSPVNM
jgi:hypothetical protein